MKPILQTAVILGLALLLSRCQTKTNTSVDLMVLDLAEAVKNPETGYASAFFDEVSITVLDGKSEWFFPRHVITGVFLEKYSLFYDMHNRTSIGVFDQEGKLVISLDRKGKGPGEYTGVNEFGMNAEQTKIFVNEGYKQKLHWYGLDGAWIESVDLPTKFNHLYMLPGGNMILQNQRYDPDEYDGTRLMLTDAKGQFIQSVWDKPKEINDYPQFLDHFWIRNTGKNGLYYRDSPLYDTLYSISDDFQLSPRFVLDAGNLSLPFKIAEDFNRSDEWRDYLRLHRYFITKTDLVISGSYKKQIHFKANLKDGTLTTYDEMVDDLIGYRNIPYEQTQDGRYLVQRVYVQSVKDNLEMMFPDQEVKLPEVRDQLKELISNADENTDMILVYYRIKK